MAQVKVLETSIQRAPLGLRFLDLVRSTAISDGLEVAAWPLGLMVQRRIAVRSPLSGVYGFRTLPGLHEFEAKGRPASDWCTPVAASPPEPIEVPGLEKPLEPGYEGPIPNFAVRVLDNQGRFLPQTLLMCLPRESLMEIPLFSSPARPTPPGQGVLRGQIWDRAADQPASWSLVTASADPTTSYVALADERGVFALFLPYASTLPPLSGSPPHGTGDMDELQWNLTIQVHYQPVHQRWLVGLEPPDTRSILEQELAQLHDGPGVVAGEIVRSIRFGQELLVVTEGLSPPNRMRLLVDPA